MRLEPLYTATFTTPESWRVGLDGPFGSEEQNFLIAGGGAGRPPPPRLRGANFPRRRTDGTLLPDFRGALETDDGATILYSWSGYARAGRDGTRELVGGIAHLTEDPRDAWLNSTYCALVGEVRPRPGGVGFEVVLDVSEVVWESIA